jgi:16S rRNA (uracil1498-N3)-methyltransferase
MFNFFVDESQKQGNTYLITDSDYNHIKNVLRMQKGDELVVSVNGKSDLCEIKSFKDETVVVKIIEENYKNTELKTNIFLFQGLPKSDKMEFIIQKAVELGVDGVIPVEMNRCVVKLDDKKKNSKQTRWQAIAESAAKQSKRNTVPTVFDVLSYKDALEKANELDMLIVPYENENGMVETKKVLDELCNCSSVGILIGPEGGFEEKEIDLAKQFGGRIISLGKRILRTETAAITAVSMCMLNIEMN